MKRILFLFILGFSFSFCFAGKISGTITDSLGNIIPFASIQIKGTNIGTTANSEGKFTLTITNGTYTIICQHVNYKRQEQTITVSNEPLIINFKLSPQQFVMEEVIIKRGEDPAYQIIRQTIKNRKKHKNELGSFVCEVYTKGQLKLRGYPKNFLGSKVDFEDGDTSKKKILYLSESFAKYSVQPPDKQKIEVEATKVSGQTNGFGLTAPEIISFYDNNIRIGDNLNPRGFISPIADNAMNFYRYKFEGSFFEEGRQISRIKVIPKRKYEPLFSGYINIVEDEWRIHSLQLQLTKESQMELVDTLQLEQLFIPVNNFWVVKSQVIYPSIKMFGFDVHGSFVNIYSAYDVHVNFPKKYFDNIILKYTDSSNKKNENYWNTERPIVLQQEEINDYKKKDSLEKLRHDPHYLDSLDRRNNKLSVRGFLTTGQNFGKRKSHSTFFLPSVLEAVNFNTVEGLVFNFSPSFSKRLDTTIFSRKSFSIAPTLRYGFSNQHFNSSLRLQYNWGKKYFNAITISGGKNIFQFNNNDPVRPRDNTISSLQYSRNYLKIYEAWFTTINWSKGIGDGFIFSAGVNYQDRMPLENTTNYKWRNYKQRMYTPNYPVELTTQNFARHQAFIASFNLRWQPGTKYIELPGQKINAGSKYPVFTLSYWRGIPDFFGSDINYSKWQASISNNLNLKLGGTFYYRIAVGGFINKKKVEIPDYTHFTGNQLTIAAPYLSSFQLAPYYKYSNIESFYTTLHIEHHFNGLLTNKIPLFRNLNWRLVAGSNAFYVNTNKYYAEAFVGLENIFKFLRVDLIDAYESNQPVKTGVRIGLDGAFFNRR